VSLYVHDRPVSGPSGYFGREVLLRSLFEGVHRGRSFVVCGGPRLGRTSTAEQLAHLIETRWVREPTQLKLVPVRVDLAAALPGGPKLFLRQLWPALTTAVLSARVFGKGEPVRAPEPNFLKAADAWAEMSEAAGLLWSRLAGTSGWCQWLLVLENADLLLSGKLDAILEPLAGFVSSGRQGAPAAMVALAGRRLREQLFETRTPIRFLRPLRLGVLRDAEAESMIRLGFPEAELAWVAEIVAATGKHPYLLQRLLAELAVVPEQPVEGAIASARADIDAWCEMVWAALDHERGVTYRGAYAAPEHALLQYLLDCGSAADLRTAERDLGIKPLKEYAELLQYLGVAERVLQADTGVLRSPVGLFNRWYAERILR
jgi:hypothetical protein